MGGDRSHLWVIWDRGTTEGGSSGSPLFDQNKRVIGQLHGGVGQCTNVNDWYGRLSTSWQGGGTSGSRLADFLDSLSTGAMTLDGRDSDGPSPDPDPDPGCAVESLGAVSGTVTRNGTLGHDCVSPNWAGELARYYSFTLARTTDVRIDMTSSAVDALARTARRRRHLRQPRAQRQRQRRRNQRTHRGQPACRHLYHRGLDGSARRRRHRGLFPDDHRRRLHGRESRRGLRDGDPQRNPRTRLRLPELGRRARSLLQLHARPDHQRSGST